ncbi:histone-like nucleoid-structuring protein Lsr2 [Streptomyces sp. LUP30]|uniref:Lsr2 family DNA-binding protein n=1 Tax=Streptomyces sp. LUP30 TaxID=1890285 RepID=UPI000851CECB|nr:histone-like nucleoid-structuring protein Lsr2 [Streptomyces sp. LUP30]
MTIAAFRRLLDQIDHEGGPAAARHNRLHLLSERTQHMTSAPAPHTTRPVVDVQLKAGADVHLRPAPAIEPEQLPVGRLLKWGDEHDDVEVRDQAARARIALAGLRQRHAADQELTAITTEAQQLEQRLAELRAREAELAPPTKRKPTRDYDPATVRAWAAQTGVDCPDRGRVPKAVVDVWRASLPQPATT